MEHHAVLQALAAWVTALARNAFSLWLAATCVAYLVLAACRLAARVMAGRVRIARRVRRRVLSARRGRRRRQETLSARRSGKLLRGRGTISGGRAE